MRGFFICIFNKKIRQQLALLCEQARLSESVFELGTSGRDTRLEWLDFFLKGAFFVHNKPFTYHTGQVCSYIWSKTWPIFCFKHFIYDMMRMLMLVK